MDINVEKILNLVVYLATDIILMIINVKSIDGVRNCHKVKLQIEGWKLESSFYTIPLVGVDIVFGIQWL